MNNNDLTLTIARCLQNFADVEKHNQNTCYVPPSLETLDERAKQSYLNDALFHRKVDAIVYSVREHNVALRSQVAELQKDVQVAKGQYQGACDIIAELQRQLSAEQEAHAATLQREAKLSLQLDEAAKQEPVVFVASIHIAAAVEKGECATIIYGDSEHLHHVEPLYRYPPNLPAIIEQAKAEEMESALKVMRHAAAALAHAAESNPLYQDAYNEIDAAIRERKP